MSAVRGVGIRMRQWNRDVEGPESRGFPIFTNTDMAEFLG